MPETSFIHLEFLLGISLWVLEGVEVQRKHEHRLGVFEKFKNPGIISL